MFVLGERRLPGVIVGVACATALLLTGCSSGDDASAHGTGLAQTQQDLSTDVGGQAGSSGTSTSPGSTDRSIEGGSSTNPSKGSSADAVAGAEAAGVAPLGNKGVRLSSIKATQKVSLDGRSLQVRVTSSKAITTKGSGPGVVNGPGLLVTVSVQNASTKPVRLDTFSTTLYSGSESTPAQSVTSDSRNHPLAATVGAGKTATGDYVFAVSEADANHLSISVLVDSTLPTLVYSTTKK